MLTDLFKRSLRREVRRSMSKIISESKRLNEALSDTLDDVASNSDASGLGDALDAQVSPAEDNKIEELKIQQQIDKRNAQINDVIIDWVSKLDEFVSFINDPMNKESIKYIIDSAAAGSILEKIKSSESRRLTKVATECSALAQSLRSYITGGVDSIEEPAADVELEPEAEPMPEEEADADIDTEDMADDIDAGSEEELV